jgi:hypothetical protein
MNRRGWWGGAALRVLGLSLCLAAGCDGTGGRVPVAGTVTFDGQPVDGGAIAFLPEGEGDGDRPKPGTRIDEGRYAILARKGPVPGVYRVQIHWAKKTGKKVPFDSPPVLIDETRQVIPEKYNTQSTLRVEVHSGSNAFDFDLKSK